MKAAIVGVLMLILGMWTGLTLDNLRGGADASQASLLPQVLYRDAQPVIVTRTLARETVVQVRQAAAETRTETRTVTVTSTPTTTTETVTLTETPEEKHERG